MSRKSENKTEFFQKNEKEIKAITRDPSGKIVRTQILECFPPKFRLPSGNGHRGSFATERNGTRRSLW